MSAPRILIIEDEPALMRGLKDTFVDHGFDVHTATDGATGLKEALANNADVILLDIMLPKMNGYELCRILRHKGVTTPVLMLTAKGQEKDIVLGLNLGADDYITKPFRVAELVARVNAFLRRQKRDAHSFGPFTLDVIARTLLREGREVSLTVKEFALLEYMAARPNRAISRNVLLNDVWGRSVIVSGRSVDRCVATLRSKIEDNARQPQYLHTIRDIGYRFCPESQEISLDQ